MLYFDSIRLRRGVIIPIFRRMKTQSVHILWERSLQFSIEPPRVPCALQGIDYRNGNVLGDEVIKCGR